MVNGSFFGVKKKGRNLIDSKQICNTSRNYYQKRIEIKRKSRSQRGLFFSEI